MPSASRILSAAFAAILLSVSLPVFAQEKEISESHLKAARAAVAAINATDEFDGILPQAALALKQELIQKNPDLEEVISQTVDEKTIALAGRRADLEKEAALAYARAMSEEDLNNIATFYNSPAGKKLLQEGPVVTRELLKAADIWQRGIGRDLAQAVGQSLDEYYKANQPAGTAQDGTAPAPEQPKAN